MSLRKPSGHKSKPAAPFPPDPDADTVALPLATLPLASASASASASTHDTVNLRPSTPSPSSSTPPVAVDDPYNTTHHHHHQRSNPSTLRSRPSVLSHASSAAEHADDTNDPAQESPSPNLDDGPMPSKPSLLRSAPNDAPSYGAVSNDPSRNVSPTGSDSRTGNSHPLRYVSDTTRSASSRYSAASRQSSRLSEDVDAAALATGLDGRFGVTQTTVTTNMLQDVKSDAAEDEVDYDDLSGSEPDDDPVDNSPHEVVRASVPPTDDITLSISTPRMWTLSVLFSVLGSSTNLFFSLRYPSVAITPVIALLLVHPLALMWDYFLKFPSDPPEEFVDGILQPDVDGGSPPKNRLTRLRRWLAQGRWNEKEHTCVYVSSNVSFGFAFATDVIVEQSMFYKQEATIPYQLLLILSTQILGYAFAGLTRRFLVRPSGMIWPGTLMSAAMFGTLHKEENKIADGWKISRWKFFFIVWFGAFAFYFLPGLLMPCLSYFNVITWIAPKNVVVANLFGVVSGLGLFPLTFDWAQITYIGSPLLVPFWAAMNVIGGLVIVMWLVAPIAYYANMFYSSYMPMLSSSVFDNTGNVYDVSKILTSEFLFDREAYSKYSRVFLPITYVLSYGVQFAALAALLTHTFCWHGKDILNTWKTALQEARDEGQVYQPVSGGSSENIRRQRSFGSSNGGLSRSSSNLDGFLFKEDVHCRLMNRYKDAPLWWYMVTFVSMLAVGMFVVEFYPIHLPWYGLLLALGICAVFFIPNGIIMAVTNQHSSIYLICQLVCGVVFPGRPIANMVFVTYGYISSAQGIKFASDLKLGHYMKIPPRIMFTVQMVATIVSSLTQIGVLNWMFAKVKGICTSEAVNGFTCPIARVHFNGSILWGVVGPGEFFGPNATYRGLVWCFLIGAIMPIPLWLYSRKKKHSIVRKINLPVVFGSMAWIPPATGLNFSVWAVVCYVFNYLIKRRKSAWWAKYTMTMSAALDSGLAFGIVVIFFGFIYPGHMKGFKYWGTEIYKKGCDWQACSYNTVPEGSHFGPDKW